MAKEKLNIPIAKTEFDDEDFQAQLKPLKSDWTVQGPHVKEFKEKWSAFKGAKYSIATTSSTSDLHMQLVALDLEEDDEIIVPALTWISSANVVEIDCKKI